MISTRRAAALVLAALVATCARGESPEPEPAATDLVETAAARLAQIDMTVTGPPEWIGTLTAEDFALWVNFRRLRSFRLDRSCTPPSVDRPQPPAPAADRASEPAPGTGSYLLYFDQTHLTLGGRAEALHIARELADELVAAGHRVMVVSDTSRLTVVQGLTASPEALRAALDRLEDDPTQWDAWASGEDLRVDEVTQRLNNASGLAGALNLARLHQKEERWRAEKSLRRLQLALSKLSTIDRPKAVVYFADTMRSNAGEHYLSFFSDGLMRTGVALGRMRSDSLMATLPFDAVVNEASAQGIRFYAIQARGLVTPGDRVMMSGSAVAATGKHGQSSRVRLSDAENTLANLATETGGQAFLHGAPPSRIARRLLEDAACVYLASFDTTELPQDVPLRVTAKLRRSGATLRVRGRLVVQSPAARLSGRLLAAFADAGQGEAIGVQAQLVPTGFADGVYTALLQVRVPGTSLLGASWDLGVSIVGKARVVHDSAGKIKVARSGVPAVLEREVRLEPGSYELVSVAHETTSGLVLSGLTRVDWPDPDRRSATIGPLSLLQPATAAFDRSGRTRGKGSVALSAGDPVDRGLPVAVVGLVCRGRRPQPELHARRSVVGQQASEFPALNVQFGADRCVQFRDILPAEKLRTGSWRWEVQLVDGEREVDRAALHFDAVDP